MYDKRDNLSDAAREEDRVERLICRQLDGEATDEECAELQNILSGNTEARHLLEEYERIDRMAGAALLAGAAGTIERTRATAAAAPVRIGGIRLAAAGALLAAAAVIAFAVVTDQIRTPTSPEWVRSSPGPDWAGPFEATGNPPTMAVPRGARPLSQFIDYRHVDFLPHRRQEDVLRDVIAVPGKNERNEDVIYIIERNTQATRLAPIVGDF